MIRVKFLEGRSEWGVKDGAIEGTCDSAGHVWTLTDDKMDQVLGEPLPEARCDCGSEEWRNHPGVKSA
jgi:hypothetical protein